MKESFVLCKLTNVKKIIWMNVDFNSQLDYLNKIRKILDFLRYIVSVLRTGFSLFIMFFLAFGVDVLSSSKGTDILKGGFYDFFEDIWLFLIVCYGLLCLSFLLVKRLITGSFDSYLVNNSDFFCNHFMLYIVPIIILIFAFYNSQYTIMFLCFLVFKLVFEIFVRFVEKRYIQLYNISLKFRRVHSYER